MVQKVSLVIVTSCGQCGEGSEHVVLYQKPFSQFSDSLVHNDQTPSGCSKEHPQSFSIFDLAYIFKDFIKQPSCSVHHCWIVHSVLKRFLHLSSEDQSYSLIPLGQSERCVKVWVISTLLSSSSVEPQWGCEVSSRWYFSQCFASRQPDISQ